MAKYIIAIWGTSNQGKSETVSLIYHEFRINFPNSTEEIFIKKKDLMLILTNGKKKIGIESQGDPGSRLNESIKN